MGQPVKVACQRCGKPVTEAVSSPLSGLWVCGKCAIADPKIVEKLDNKTKFKLGLKTTIKI